jgi:hypothetical protein
MNGFKLRPNGLSLNLDSMNTDSLNQDSLNTDSLNQDSLNSDSSRPGDFGAFSTPLGPYLGVGSNPTLDL